MTPNRPDPNDDGLDDDGLDDFDDDSSALSRSTFGGYPYSHGPRVKKTPVTIGLEPEQLEGLKKLVAKGGPLAPKYGGDGNYADALRTAIDELIAKHAKPKVEKVAKKKPARKVAKKKPARKVAKKKPARKAAKKRPARKAAKKRSTKRSRR